MQEAREVLSVTEIAFAYHQTDAVDLDAARADFMRCEANSQQSNRRYWEIKDELEAQTRPVPPVRQQSPTSRPGSTRPQSKAQATRPATVTTRPQATVSAGRR